VWTFAGGDIAPGRRAAVIDTILFLVICAPLVTWVYGRNYWLDPEKFGFIAGPADILIN